MHGGFIGTCVVMSLHIPFHWTTYATRQLVVTPSHACRFYRDLSCHVTLHTISLDNLQDNWLLTSSYGCWFYQDSCCHVTPHTISLDNLQDNWLLTPSYACWFYQDSCCHVIVRTQVLNLQLQAEDQCMEVTPEIPMTPHTTSWNNAQAKDLSRDHSREEQSI